MTDWIAIAGAGVWAGMINAVVGSGTLVTFPVLLLLGYPPLVANVSNSIGQLGGNISGAIGYRRERVAARHLVRLVLPASILGGLTGAVVLLVLPAEAFASIVPVLVVAGVTMVVIGPAVQRRAARRRGGPGEPSLSRRRLTIIVAVIFALGVYGGYFGAAQGILVVGAMSLLTTLPLQTLNGLKNLLVSGVNGVAAIVFVAIAHDRIDWVVVALILTGSTIGGTIGARFGRRLPPFVLRSIIVVVGVAAVVNMTVLT